MNFDSVITKIFASQDDYHLDFAPFTEKISALYVYYHYINADLSRLDEVIDAQVNTIGDNSFDIKSICRSTNIEECIDFNSVVKKEDFLNLSNNDLVSKIKAISATVGKIVYHEFDSESSLMVQKFDELNVKLTENTSYLIRLICPFELSIDKKIYYQQLTSEIKVNNQNVMFEMIFGDDLEEEVSDVESPKEYVASGSLNLINNSVCYFGGEESFITLVSAKSIKQLYLQYSTRGLFASNLRFYITNKKIDGKIVYTIQTEPENFCYFNNGIIITCDNYELSDGRINLQNFSIVNGGQTSNLIGRTSFDNDFGVICKVIKNKYPDNNDKINFLSKVAEASNMQKPINAKDLIANKPEQRKLKIQFSEAGMFLKIKRGEKIDKRVYGEAYMNASNDEIAQLLYSYVFQCPGAAKNSKSTLLSNEKIYNLIFKNEYSSDFFKSIQIIKVAYADWQKKLAKTEPHSSIIYGLSKSANFLTAGVIGFYLKFIINSEIRSVLLDTRITDVCAKNINLKNSLKVNDIGTVSLINPSKFDQITKSSFFDLFEYLFDSVLIPAYQKYKKAYPTYAFSQFCKSDAYYYDYILPRAKAIICSPENMKTISNYFYLFNTEAIADVAPKDEPEDFSADSLTEELKVYRQRIADDSGKSIKAYDVIRTMQLSLIVREFPRTTVDLYKKCSMTDEQISLYGADILKIVAKYIKTEDFK